MVVKEVMTVSFNSDTDFLATTKWYVRLAKTRINLKAIQSDHSLRWTLIG